MWVATLSVFVQVMFIIGRTKNGKSYRWVLKKKMLIICLLRMR